MTKDPDRSDREPAPSSERRYTMDDKRDRPMPASAGAGPVFSPEGIVTGAMVAIFFKAYLEALGRRAGEGTAALLPRMRGLKTKREEVLISSEGNENATIVITASTPDEARLALLDLDITAPELRGKLLHWDMAAGAWGPIEAPRIGMDKASPGD